MSVEETLHITFAVQLIFVLLISAHYLFWKNKYLISSHGHSYWLSPLLKYVLVTVYTKTNYCWTPIMEASSFISH